MNQLLVAPLALSISLISSWAIAQGTSTYSLTTESSYGQLYNETSQLSRTRDIVTQGNAYFSPVSLGTHFEFHIGAAWSQDNLSTQTVLYNDNYVAPYLGVQWNLSALSSFISIEQRFVQELTNAFDQSDSRSDTRVNWIFYHWFDLSRIHERYFNEDYGALVYSSRYEQGLLQAWSKFGRRFRFSKEFATDAYTELAFFRDELGYYYNNYQELRTGFRLTATLQPLTLALMETYDLGSYQGREYLDKNPYGSTYGEWRTLLALYGTF